MKNKSEGEMVMCSSITHWCTENGFTNGELYEVIGRGEYAN